MILNTKEKKDIVKKINELTLKSLSIITANFCGVKSQEINNLRKIGRENSIHIFVTRNSLIKRALKNTQFEKLSNILKYPTIIAFSLDHPRSAARLFRDFSKKNKNFKIKNAMYNGNLMLSEHDINDLAEMPTYKESLVRLIIIIKEISIIRILRVLRAICKIDMN